MPVFDIAVNPEEFETWMHAEARAGRGRICVIESQPRSKANSRMPTAGVSKAGKKYVRFIKSQKALGFDAIAKSSKVLYGNGGPVTPYEQDVLVYALLAYPSRRSDVDESLLLDSMQGKLYVNDRQCRNKLIVGVIDKLRPRATIFVKPI
jgi:hypothetical protein